MSNEVVIEKSEMGLVPLSQAGHRIYVTIINNTPNEIVMIDRAGFKQKIKPNRYKEQNNIKIIRQSHDGDFETLNEDSAKYDTTTYTIRRHSVERSGGIYIDGEDIVLCSASNSDYIKHPHATMTFDDVISEKVDNSLNLTGKLIFIANDPQARHSKLFISVMGYCVEIECTHFTDIDPILTCRLKNDKENYILIDDNIENIFENKVLSFDVNGTAVSIGISKEDVIKESKKIFRDKLVLSRKEFQQKLDDHKKDIDRDNSIAMESKKEIIRELELKVSKLENSIADLKLSIERKNFIIEKYEARDDIDKERMKKELIKENLEYKRDEQVHKSHRASVAAGSETVKAMGTAAKVVVGVAIGAVAAALTIVSKGSSLALLALL